MAQIQEETFVIKISKLVRSDVEDAARITDNEFVNNVTAIVQELVGDSVIVEIEGDR